MRQTLVWAGPWFRRDLIPSLKIQSQRKLPFACTQALSAACRSDPDALQDLPGAAVAAAAAAVAAAVVVAAAAVVVVAAAAVALLLAPQWPVLGDLSTTRNLRSEKNKSLDGGNSASVKGFSPDPF